MLDPIHMALEHIKDHSYKKSRERNPTNNAPAIDHFQFLAMLESYFRE